MAWGAIRETREEAMCSMLGDAIKRRDTSAIDNCMQSLTFFQPNDSQATLATFVTRCKALDDERFAPYVRAIQDAVYPILKADAALGQSLELFLGSHIHKKRRDVPDQPLAKLFFLKQDRQALLAMCSIMNKYDLSCPDLKEYFALFLQLCQETDSDAIKTCYECIRRKETMKWEPHNLYARITKVLKSPEILVNLLRAAYIMKNEELLLVCLGTVHGRASSGDRANVFDKVSNLEPLQEIEPWVIERLIAKSQEEDSQKCTYELSHMLFFVRSISKEQFMQPIIQAFEHLPEEKRPQVFMALLAASEMCCDKTIFTSLLQLVALFQLSLGTAVVALMAKTERDVKSIKRWAELLNLISGSFCMLVKEYLETVPKSDYGCIFNLLQLFLALSSRDRSIEWCRELCLGAIDRYQIHHMLPYDLQWPDPDNIPPQILRARAPLFEYVGSIASDKVLRQMRLFIATGRMPERDLPSIVQLYLFAKQIGAGSFIYKVEESYFYDHGELEYSQKDLHIQVLRVAQGTFRERLKTRLLRLACKTFDANPAAAKELIIQMRMVDPKIFGTINLHDLLSDRVRYARETNYGRYPAFTSSMLATLKELTPEVEELDAAGADISPVVLAEMQMGECFSLLRVLHLHNPSPAHVQACSGLRLEGLKLLQIRRTDSFFATLFAMRPAFFDTLEVFELSTFHPLSVEGAKMLFSHLGAVKTLVLHSSEITDEFLELIQANMPHLRSFSGRPCYGLSAQALCRFYQHYPNMQEVGLECFTRLRFDNVSPGALDSLRACRELISLAIPDVDDEVALQLIEDHPKLQELHLVNSHITDATIPALTRLKRLEVLKITGTSLKDNEICELVFHLPSLRVLTIERSSYSSLENQLSYLPQRGVELIFISNSD